MNTTIKRPRITSRILVYSTNPYNSQITRINSRRQDRVVKGVNNIMLMASK